MSRIITMCNYVCTTCKATINTFKIAGLSLRAKLRAGPWRVVPLNFASECSLDSGPPLASKSKCSKLRAFLSAGPGWIPTP